MTQSLIGLLLAVPLGAAATIGGPFVVALTLVGTFFLYDYVFVPQHVTMTMGGARNAIPLGVYVVVAIAVRSLRELAPTFPGGRPASRGEGQYLVDVIGTLATNQPLNNLLGELVQSVRDTFVLDGVALVAREWIRF